VRNEKGLKIFERVLRIGSLNVGTLTRKGREIVDLVERRKLDILCLQETRWKGNKSKDLAGGHKFVYSGMSGNGVGIVIATQ
jgi:exonuclease III